MPALQDVVYKDIIEPLESVSVNLVPTDKDDITLFGTPEEVRVLFRSLRWRCLAISAENQRPTHQQCNIWMCSLVNSSGRGLFRLPCSFLRCSSEQVCCREQVASTLADKVLTSPKQQTKVLEVKPVRQCSPCSSVPTSALPLTLTMS